MVTDGDDFNVAMKLLLKALDINLRHVRYHTRLLTRAIECVKNKDKRLLLKGDGTTPHRFLFSLHLLIKLHMNDTDLKRAKHWLGMCSLNTTPSATLLIHTFVTSR
jgi:hypothetical protein